jgi:RNA 2',3'-cyclic 3'-phosphodiesterase
MRLFISINVPSELHDYCRQLQKRFPGIKNVDEFHLTIQFLGDGIHEQFLPRLTEALTSIHFNPFEIKLGTPRRFPNEDRPSGVWIDCDGGETLRDLADRIRKIMDKIGFRPDKPFAAHITLGRYKTPPTPVLRSRSERPQPEPKTETKTFKVDRFYLMESHLTPEGPTYKTLAEF